MVWNSWLRRGVLASGSTVYILCSTTIYVLWTRLPSVHLQCLLEGRIKAIGNNIEEKGAQPGTIHDTYDGGSGGDWSSAVSPPLAVACSGLFDQRSPAHKSDPGRRRRRLAKRRRR